MEIKDITSLASRIRENVAKVIVGKDDVIELVIISLIAGGHVLLEDVPGTGKTVMARASPNRWMESLSAYNLHRTCCLQILQDSIYSISRTALSSSEGDPRLQISC